jgi:hypothetical protein
VHAESDGAVTVGLDDLGSRLLAKPDSVALPPAGARVEINGTAFRDLLRASEIKPWVRREMERLQLALSARKAVSALSMAVRR